jgi:hypothetical protein
MDLEFSPSILDTPSLITPNITLNQLIYKPSHTISTDDVTNVSNNKTSSSNSSIITTTSNESLPVSSAEMKLSRIEHELKQSFNQRRKPTESPFQRMAEASGLTNEKNVALLPSTDDGIPLEVPSTAEVNESLSMIHFLFPVSFKGDE